MGIDEELEAMEDDFETDAELAEEENSFDLEEEYEDDELGLDADEEDLEDEYDDDEYEDNDDEDFEDEEEYEEDEDDEYDLGITREGVAEATDDFNAIYKEGMETAKELKEAFDDIKDAFNLGGLFKK